MTASELAADKLGPDRHMGLLVRLVGGRQGRDRRTLATAGTSLLARMVALAAALVSVRLSIHYLGAARYGLWATITSVAAFLAFSDLGIGNAMINRMSAALASGDREVALKEVSSASAVLSAIAIAVVVIGVALLPVLPWDRIYNVSGRAAVEAGPATLVYVTCFAILLPLGLVQKVQLGFQDGAIANLWLTAGNILGLVLLVVFISLSLSLPWLVLALPGAAVLTTGLNWIQEFYRSRPWIRPRRRAVEFRVGIGLGRTGLLFLGLQLAGVVAFSSDNLVAAQVLGPVAVAQYSVTQRVFLVLPSLISVAAVSLWPAYGEALIHGDRAWIRRTLGRSTLAAVGATIIGSLVILALAKIVFSFLVGPSLVPPLALMLGFTVWAALFAFGNVISMLLNAANVILFQLIAASVMAITSIILKIEFAHAFGVSGIIWGTVLAYGACSAIPTLLYLRHRRRIDW
jgi:O-antigen/teichoic acid export membrane protein